MRWMVGLLTVLLTGCQGLSLLDVPPERDPQIMPLWEQYQRCRVATDPDELIYLVHHFDAVRVTGVPPPAWLKGWGPHVKPQPIRTTIDPQAIGAACTLRAAALLVEKARLSDAWTMYERVLTHYADPDRQYYSAQAREALARLSELRPTMAAAVPFHPTPLQR